MITKEKQKSMPRVKDFQKHLWYIKTTVPESH